MGALAQIADQRLTLQAVAAATDGSVVLRRTLTGLPDDPVGLGTALAALLLDEGAATLVEADADRRVDSDDQADPTSTRSTSSLPLPASPERAS